jgi:hypothetical protein
MTTSGIVALTGDLPAGPFVPAPAVRLADDIDIPMYRLDGVTARRRVHHGRGHVPGSRGRFCHSTMPSMTLSVMVEMVCLETGTQPPPQSRFLPVWPA